MKSLKIATVGCGYFSQFHYAAWQRLPVKLIAVANREVDIAQEIAAQYQIPKIYPDLAALLAAEKPDLLDIITPSVTHLPYMRLAAEHGVDVICQKPFTTSMTEAEEAVQIAEDAGIKLVIHENFRFQPWYRAIARLLQENVLGELYNVQFRLRPGDGQGPEAYLERQPTFQQMPRFLMNETGVHLLDVFRFLFGEIDSVYADLRRLNPAIKGEDAGHVLLRFASGLSGHFDGNRLADHPAENRRLTMGELSIEGSTGELVLTGDAQIMLRRHGDNEWLEHPFEWADIGFGGDCVFRFQEHVVRHYLEGSVLENTGRDYLRNLRLVEAVYDSDEEERLIRVTQAGENL